MFYYLDYNHTFCCCTIFLMAGFTYLFLHMFPHSLAPLKVRSRISGKMIKRKAKCDYLNLSGSSVYGLWKDGRSGNIAARGNRSPLEVGLTLSRHQLLTLDECMAHRQQTKILFYGWRIGWSSTATSTSISKFNLNFDCIWCILLSVLDSCDTIITTNRPTC